MLTSPAREAQSRAEDDVSDPGSAFLLLARLCRKRYIQRAELGPIVHLPSFKRASLFHLGPKLAQRMCTFVGESPARWRLALGRDFTCQRSSNNVVPAYSILLPKNVLADYLRYCPACLDEGWHTATFQHLTVRCCPTHNATLVNCCPRCGARIETSAVAVIENHLHCGKCAKRLGIVEAVPDVDRDAFDRLRMAIEFPESRDYHSLARLDSGGVESTSHVRGVNELALHCDRSSKAIAGVRHFKPRIFKFPEIRSSRNPHPRMLQYKAVQATLLELNESLRTAGALSEAAACELQASTASHKPRNVEISIPAAALWNTSVVFGLRADDGVFDSQADCSAESLSGWTNPYEYLLPWSLEAIGTCARELAVSYFASRLTALAFRWSSVDDSWDCRIPARAFAPAWKMCARSGFVELEVRSRFDMKTVKRLIRRYASRHILHPTRKLPPASRLL
jgi:hypothetical protein